MSGKSTLKNFKSMLAEAKLPERTVDICLRGDLVADHEETERQLEKVQQKALTGNSFDGDGGQVAILADKLVGLEDQMREHTYAFRLRAMSRPAFRALVTAYPPRRNEEGEIEQLDRSLGINAETFFEALIRACLVDPELDDEDWKTLAEERLTDKQFDVLSDAAWFLNRGDVDVPFSRAASRANRSSEPA